MKSKRKYKEGKKFKTPVELFVWLYEGHSIYQRGKYVHNAWAVNWSIRYIINDFASADFRQAVPNKKGVDNK